MPRERVFWDKLIQDKRKRPEASRWTTVNVYGLITISIVMAGNPQRYRAALHQMENRHATAGCLLGLLFVVPFAARVYSMAPLLTGALVYVAVIVPLATGMMSTQTIVRWMRCSVATLSDVGVLSRLWMLLRLFHHSYMRLDVIHTTTNQVTFFMLAEKVMCPDQRLVCLYMLLFYTVMAYLQRSLKLHNWTRIPSSHTRGDFLRLTTAFVAIRLGKAVVVSLVLVMLRVNFKHLEPSFPYVAVTGVHFLVTQCCTSAEQAWGDEEGSIHPAGYAITFLAVFLRWLCPQEHMEGLEERWAAFLLRCLPSFMSAAMIGMALTRTVLGLGRSTMLMGNLSVLVLAAYINLMADGLRAKREAWEPLARDMNLLSNYPVKNIKIEAGESSLPTCAICLDDLVGKARVTPCQHTFHGRCLRPCIQRFGECPLCKHPL